MGIIFVQLSQYFYLNKKPYILQKKIKGGGCCPLNGDGLVCKISSGFNYFLILFNESTFYSNKKQK